jgi:hypothetical protein
MVPTGIRPPARHRDLVARFDALPPAGKLAARRDAAALRDTHTLFASWSVAINRAELEAASARRTALI